MLVAIRYQSTSSSAYECGISYPNMSSDDQRRGNITPNVPTTILFAPSLDLQVSYSVTDIGDLAYDPTILDLQRS